MTRKEAIEFAKDGLREEISRYKCLGYLVSERKYTDALEVLEKETTDIPIGAPCEFDSINGISIGYFSHFYDGVPQFVFRKDEIGMHDCGINGHSVRQLNIWDIDEKYGGAPYIAAAMAYKQKHITIHWLYSEEAIHAHEQTGYTVERRPEED